MLEKIEKIEQDIKDIIKEINKIKLQIFPLLNKDYEDKKARIIKPNNRYKILVRQQWKCNQCACKLKYNLDSDWKGEVAHIDHIHPFSKKETYVNGEENISELENLQALCPKCNLSKGGKEVH